MTKVDHPATCASTVPFSALPPASGLYDPRYEHDACGVGFVVHMKGKKSHEIVENALRPYDLSFSRYELLRLLAFSRSGALPITKASDRLQAMREETGKLRDLSFDTISGAGPNGAIVHYRVTGATNRRLTPMPQSIT